MVLWYVSFNRFRLRSCICSLSLWYKSPAGSFQIFGNGQFPINWERAGGYRMDSIVRHAHAHQTGIFHFMCALIISSTQAAIPTGPGHRDRFLYVGGGPSVLVLSEFELVCFVLDAAAFQLAWVSEMVGWIFICCCSSCNQTLKYMHMGCTLVARRHYPHHLQASQSEFVYLDQAYVTQILII